MDIAKLFYVGGMSLAVLVIPTALVFMHWFTRETAPAEPKAARPTPERAVDVHGLQEVVSQH